MPHKSCSACLHEDRTQIDTALRTGQPPLRVLAGRVGLSKSALDRHRKHIDHAQTSINNGELKRIDAEISKLIRAQNRAKRHRDNATALAISRELRNWHTLRVKAEALTGARPAEQADMSRTEALDVARALVEADIAAGASDTIAWLLQLAASISATNSAFAEFQTNKNADEQDSEP